MRSVIEWITMGRIIILANYGNTLQRRVLVHLRLQDEIRRLQNRDDDS